MLQLIFNYLILKMKENKTNNKKSHHCVKRLTVWILRNTAIIVAVLHRYATSKRQCKSWICDLADNLPGQQMQSGDSSGKEMLICGSDQGCQRKFAAVLGKEKAVPFFARIHVKYCLLLSTIIHQVIPVVFSKSSLSLTCRMVMELVNSYVKSLKQHCFLHRIL